MTPYYCCYERSHNLTGSKSYHKPVVKAKDEADAMAKLKDRLSGLADQNRGKYFYKVIYVRDY